MVVGTAFGWGNWPTTALAVVLAFLFGYGLTLRGVVRAGVGFGVAVRVALAADAASIAVMELIDNGTVAVWPAALHASLADLLFWTSLALSLALAFLVTTPVNRWMIGRGKGHAVAHRYHHRDGQRAPHEDHGGMAGSATGQSSGPSPGSSWYE